MGSIRQFSHTVLELTGVAGVIDPVYRTLSQKGILISLLIVLVVILPL